MFHILIVFKANVDVKQSMFFKTKENAQGAFDTVYNAKVRNDNTIISDDFGHMIFVEGADLLTFAFTDIQLEHDANIEMTLLQQQNQARMNNRLANDPLVNMGSVNKPNKIVS